MVVTPSRSMPPSLILTLIPHRRYLRAFKEDTVTADSRKPNKPVRKPLKSMIIDHSNDQHAGDHIAAEIAEKQRVNAVVSAALENAKRQNKRINDRSDDQRRDHPRPTVLYVIAPGTRHLDDDGERFEFEAGDYLMRITLKRGRSLALCCVGPGPMFWKPLFWKSLFSSPYAGERRGYVYSPWCRKCTISKKTMMKVLRLNTVSRAC